MRMGWIGKIHIIKPRFYRIVALVTEIMPVGKQGQMGIFVVINELCEPFLAQRSQDGFDDETRLAGSGRAGDQHSPSAVDDVDPTLALAMVLVEGGQVDGIVIFKKPFFLGECFVFVVEYFVAEAVSDDPG